MNCVTGQKHILILVNSIEAGIYNKRTMPHLKTYHLEAPLIKDNSQSSLIFLRENENYGERKRRQTADDSLRKIPQHLVNENMDLESLLADYETDYAKPIRFEQEIKQTSQIGNLKQEPQKISRQISLLDHEANLRENSEEENENSIEDKEESGISDSYKGNANDKTYNGDYKFKKLSTGKNEESRNRNAINDKLNLYKSILNDDQLINSKQTACCSNSDLSSCQQCSQHVEGGALANRYVKSKNNLKVNNNQPSKMDGKTKSKDFSFKSHKSFKNQEEEDDDDGQDDDQKHLNPLKYPTAVLKSPKQETQNSNLSAYNDLNFTSPKKNSETMNQKDKSLTWNSYQTLNDDQLENAKNNLSHEANYKLSKTEQDASEKKKDFSWKWGIFKRSHQFNPMNEIKLKTSSRLMKKGFGASLPSYSLGETRKELMIENMLRKKEKLLQLEKEGKWDVDNVKSLKESFGDDVMEPYDQLDDLVNKPLESDLGSIVQKYRVYNRQKRMSNDIERFKREVSGENVKNLKKKLLKVEVPKAKDLYLSNNMESWRSMKDMKGYAKNKTDIKSAKGKPIQNNTKSYKKALSSENIFAKQTSESRPLQLLKQPLQRRKRSLQLETSTKAFSTNETQKLFSNAFEKAKISANTFKLAKRHNSLKALHSKNNKNFAKQQAFNVKSYKKLLKHTQMVENDDVKENNDLKNDLNKGHVKKLYKKAVDLKKPLKALASNTLAKTSKTTKSQTINKSFPKISAVKKSSLEKCPANDLKAFRKANPSFFAENAETDSTTKKYFNKSKTDLTIMKEKNWHVNNSNESFFRETNQRFFAEKADNTTKQSFNKDQTDLTIMREKNLHVNNSNSNESFFDKYHENLNTTEEGLLKKSLIKSFKPKISFKRSVTNNLKRNLQINGSTKSNQSFKRSKRSLKTNPLENDIKSETSYYKDLYKPQFNFDYANTKLLKSNPENEFSNSRQVFQNEELQGNLNQDFDFTFNREKFANLNDRDLALQKFSDINFNKLWQEDKSHKSEKRLIKPVMRKNNPKHWQHKTQNKRQNVALNKNNINNDFTGNLKLDDFPLKVQLLKDKYLNDLENFNKNYKFNENHFTWPQTNFKNYISPTDNSTEMLTTTTEDAKNLTLELRNEILNCKAFASLEEFLKSLPQNITNSLFNPQTELNSSTEKIEMDVNTEVITETSTISTPTVVDSTTICTSTEEVETTTEEAIEDNTQCTEIDYEEITECNSEENLDETSTESVSESVTEETLSNTTCAAENDVKLNISINANVHGSLKTNNFCGNGSFNIVPGLKDDRLRRGVLSDISENFQKRKCAEIPTQKP
ncbi:hypothetical protein FF38_02643 [Lucilia cuprina]|uniref:Uncharacterized protein n=1 Tax=Lucilia cuprina TaxID=7375 RepID=A0A0L0C4A8_LUCCU|nr:hypothetical protein FF38_02643 [Lucilia cuprina]